MPPAEVMQPLDDPVLSHSFTRYGNVPQAEAINPNFVLTRAMPLMQGSPHCGTCTHDRRHVRSLGITSSRSAPDPVSPISNAPMMSGIRVRTSVLDEIREFPPSPRSASPTPRPIPALYE